MTRHADPPEHSYARLALGGRQPGVWLSATPRRRGPDSTARHQLPTVAGRPRVQVRRIGRTCPLHNEHELAPDLVRRIRTAIAPTPFPRRVRSSKATSSTFRSPPSSKEAKAAHTRLVARSPALLVVQSNQTARSGWGSSPGPE